MNQKTKAILAGVALAASTLAVAQTSAQQDTSRQAKQQSAQVQDSGVIDGVTVLLPTVIATGDGFNNGCWVRLYDGPNLTGEFATVGGPIDLPNMRMPNGENWEGEADSAVVGPKARVTIYSGDNYEEREGVLPAGARIPHLARFTGAFEDVESMKVRCTR